MRFRTRLPTPSAASSDLKQPPPGDVAARDRRSRGVNEAASPPAASGSLDRTITPAFLADGHAADPAVEWKQSVEEQASRKETQQRVRQTIEMLPEDFRTVLMLRDIEGYDTAQTAAALGIQPGR